MKWQWRKWIPVVVFSLFLVPMVAFAQAVVDPSTGDVNLTSLATTLYNAIVHKQWWILAAAAVLGIVYLMRKYGGLIHGKVGAFLQNPIVSWLLPVLVACVGEILTALLAGKPITDGLEAAFKIAATAVFAYVGKKQIAEHVEASKAAAVAVVQSDQDALNVLAGKGPQP